MSVVAFIKNMQDLGFSLEDAVRAAEAYEAVQAPEAPVKTARQQRNQRYYETHKASEKRLKASETSYSDALPPEEKVSPTPPSKTQTPTPFTPLKGGVSPSRLAELAETVWALQPVVGGKRKCTRPDVAKAAAAAVKRGGEPDDIEAACRAFYALPDCTKDGGQFAKGAVPLLAENRWREFLPGQGAATPAKPVAVFDGPPELRAMIAKEAGEENAAKYVDPARWHAASRTLIARNSYSAERLTKLAPNTIARTKINISTTAPAPTEQAA